LYRNKLGLPSYRFTSFWKGLGLVPPYLVLDLWFTLNGVLW
jgi:hypothetical protein